MVRGVGMRQAMDPPNLPETINANNIMYIFLGIWFLQQPVRRQTQPLYCKRGRRGERITYALVLNNSEKVGSIRALESPLESHCCVSMAFEAKCKAKVAEFEYIPCSSYLSRQTRRGNHTKRAWYDSAKH